MQDLLKRGTLPVTHEVAGSSPVVPASLYRQTSGRLGNAANLSLPKGATLPI